MALKISDSFKKRKSFPVSGKMSHEVDELLWGEENLRPLIAFEVRCRLG